MVLIRTDWFYRSLIFQDIEIPWISLGFLLFLSNRKQQTRGLGLPFASPLIWIKEYFAFATIEHEAVVRSSELANNTFLSWLAELKRCKKWFHSLLTINILYEERARIVLFVIRTLKLCGCFNQRCLKFTKLNIQSVLGS